MQFKQFGIEIRKIGNTKDLYSEVDLVLARNDVGVQVGDKTQKMTVAHSLHRMLQVNNHFDVCTIRNCAEVCQIVIPKERMSVYSAIHCINWNEMLPDYRQVIIAMVLDDFRPILHEKGNE